MFLCHSHCLNLMELYLSWIQRYIWGKIAQTSISKPFRIILFPCLFTLGLYIGRSINGLVFFFAAFAEVQVTVLSVLNLPRQGFPTTCPIGHCCVCSPRLFASEIFCNLPTYNKQRMNKMGVWKSRKPESGIRDRKGNGNRKRNRNRERQRKRNSNVKENRSNNGDIIYLKLF